MAEHPLTTAQTVCELGDRLLQAYMEALAYHDSLKISTRGGFAPGRAIETFQLALTNARISYWQHISEHKCRPTKSLAKSAAGGR